MTSTPEGKPLALLIAALLTGTFVGGLVALALREEAVEEPARKVRKRADAFIILLWLLVALSLLEVMYYAARMESIR